MRKRERWEGRGEEGGGGGGCCQNADVCSLRKGHLDNAILFNWVQIKAGCSQRLDDCVYALEYNDFKRQGRGGGSV